MNGTAHALGGGVVGGVVGMSVGVETVSVNMGMLVGLGAVAGLVPDLDVNGKLSNKITISHKLLKGVASLIGILLMLYSFLQVEGIQKWFGMGIGLGIIILASKFITQKRMLTFTGGLVLISGVSLSTLWIILIGIYILVASFLPHRSYTHSLIGLAFFTYIAYLVSVDFSHIEGLFLALIGGYASHLIADFKILPFNRRGVKLLQPFTKFEL